MDILIWLQNWYKQQCDGCWEHLYGIEIGNLDNPGWTVKIDLSDTSYEDKDFFRLIFKMARAGSFARKIKLFSRDMEVLINFLKY